MEYSNLLNLASESDDPTMRILYVTAFGVAHYRSSDKRTNKPFNPILGETFELIGEYYKYFAE